MFHIVYKTVRQSTGEYYIGVHSSTKLNDSYLGSGYRIKNLIRKYGKSDFVRTNMHLCETRYDALQLEYRLLSPTTLFDPLCLNICVGGKGNPLGGHGISEEAKTKLSNLHTGKKLSVDTKSRISKSKKNQPSPLKNVARPTSTRTKISNSQKGKIKSSEHKQKLSEAIKLVWANRKAQTTE